MSSDPRVYSMLSRNRSTRDPSAASPATARSLTSARRSYDSAAPSAS